MMAHNGSAPEEAGVGVGAARRASAPAASRSSPPSKWPKVPSHGAHGDGGQKGRGVASERGAQEGAAASPPHRSHASRYAPHAARAQTSAAARAHDQAEGWGGAYGRAAEEQLRDIVSGAHGELSSPAKWRGHVEAAGVHAAQLGGRGGNRCPRGSRSAPKASATTLHVRHASEPKTTPPWMAARQAAPARASGRGDGDARPCPAGHPLSAFVTDMAGYSCSLCGRIMPKAGQM